jgi:CRP-like cAMP-binding protein
MKIVRLAALPRLRHLRRDQLERVAAEAAERVIPAGRRFLLDGPLASELAIVVAGRGVVRCAGEALPDLGPGDVLGASAPRQPPYATATVTAATDLRLVVFGARALARLRESEPDAAAMLLAACAVPDDDAGDEPADPRPPAHLRLVRDAAA